MARQFHTAIEAPPAGSDRPAPGSRLVWGALALLAVLLMAAAIGLWARHGSAVFFDLIASGIAYCF